MIQLKKIDHSYSLDEREKFISTFKLYFEEHPSVYLQTCNRVEIYEGDGKAPDEVIRHLFRLVSGLESKMIGETAIIGQVKESYLSACKNYRLNKTLHRLFQMAFHVGKRVRAETGISKGAVSHSQAAVYTICGKLKTLCDKHITIIGINNVNENIIKYLIGKGAQTILIGNRNIDKAIALSKKYNCSAFTLDQLTTVLKETDILISATSAPHLIVKYNDFPMNKNMLILDLAVPRDIDPRIALLETVYMYNIEQIETIVEQNISKRSHEILKAESIIEEEIHKFSNWQCFVNN